MTNASVANPKTKKSSAKAKAAHALPTTDMNLPATNKKISINSTDRQQLIAAAAYLKAEARGFQGTDSLGDWLAAETEIDSQYSVNT